MRTRFIVIIAALVIALGVIAYFFINRAPSAGTPQTTGQAGSLPGVTVGTGNGLGTSGTNTSTSLPTVGGGSVAIVDAGPVAGYFGSVSGTVTVVHTDGTILSTTNGQTLSLSSSSINDLISAAFSYDGRKVAVVSGSISNPQTSIFDVQNRAWTQLSMGALSPAWSPIDYRMAYLRNGGNGTESLSMIDLSKAKPAPAVVGTWYMQDMGVQWTIPGTIMLSGRPSAYDDTSVLAFDLAKGTIAPVMISRGGFSAIWNATPQIGLSLSTTPAQRGGRLQFIDTSGATLQNLSFVTLPSKCVFGQAIGAAPSSTVPSVTIPTSTRTGSATSTRVATPTLSFYSVLYCAVPNDQDTLSFYPLPDAYLQHTISTNDTVYRIDTMTGRIDTVFSGLTAGLDATTLHVAGTKLYFINWYDKKLYSVITP